MVLISSINGFEFLERVFKVKKHYALRVAYGIIRYIGIWVRSLFGTLNHSEN